MSGESLIISAQGATFRVALCAYVMARGGGQVDVQRMYNNLKDKRPSADLQETWRHLDEAWEAR